MASRLAISSLTLSSLFACRPQILRILFPCQSRTTRLDITSSAARLLPRKLGNRQSTSLSPHPPMAIQSQTARYANNSISFRPSFT